MEFGRVPENELSRINFSLPAEPVFNRQVLKGKRAPQPKVYLGCDKWGHTAWVGKIYPSQTKEKDFLQHYVQHYNCVELNATHYKVFGEAVIKKWVQKAADRDFKFCPKMYQGITHRGSLKGKDLITNEFFRGIMAFEAMLGPIFIQLSETFSPKRKEELFDFLRSLPADLQFFLELRHPDWFAKAPVWEEFITTMRELNMGIVITDTSGRRDCAHMHLTVPRAFIRYVGNSLHPSDYTRADAWVERMQYWLDNGMEEIYFFIHMQDEATSPELTAYLVDKLNTAAGLHLSKPQYVLQQGGLFE